MNAERQDAPLLRAALAFAADGIPVFPLAPNSKKPLIPREAGGNGVHDATTDEAQIRAWWRANPRANIGIAGGHGLIFLDEDTYKGADSGGLLLPVTRSVSTPRGGLHRYFSYAGPLGNAVEGKLADGIGFRGLGYYVVAPPSSVGGKSYEWIDEQQPIAALPERIARMIRGEIDASGNPVKPTQPTPIRGRRKSASQESDGMYWADKAADKARGEGRNNAGMWLAGQLRDNRCADPEGAMIYYAALVGMDGDHPYTEREALATWRSMARRGPREPARSQNRPARARPAANPTQNITEPITDGANALQEPDEIESLLLRGEADDNGNAEAMFRLFGREYLYTPAIGWLQWTGTHWQEVPEPIVQQKAITALKRRRIAAVKADKEYIVKATKQDRARVTGCLTLFKSYVIEPDVATFDSDPDLLNCANGVLNLRTGALTPHNPKQRFTYCLAIPWNPQADSTAWEAWILDALGGNAASADYLQLCVGYSLTGHTREEKLFYLYGPTRAGKGTTTETLLHLLPRPLSNEVDFATFTAKRDSDSQNFDLAALKPARFIVASESNRSQSLNSAKIKQLTGGNYVRCAFKHKDMFEYRPQFKVWLVSNWEVKADPDDTAIWGRVQVFNFPNSHLGQEDVMLKARMRSPEALQGVLRWAVEGAMRWYATDHMEPPEAVVKATAEHRDSQDYIKQWITDYCEMSEGAWSQSSALMKSYTAWCEANNVRSRSPNDFADALRRFGCVQKRQAGTGLRGFTGIVPKIFEV